VDTALVRATLKSEPLLTADGTARASLLPLSIVIEAAPDCETLTALPSFMA
jgi:hypothetical protein